MTQALSTLDDFRGQLAHKETFQQIVNYFGGDEDTARKFMSSAVHVVRKVPDLLKCDRASLMEALITCADLRLFPSSASGEAYILPYNGVAQFQLGYQGIVTLLYRAGIRDVVAEPVRKTDVFKISRGKITHEVDAFKTRAERGPVIGYYAIITTQNGGTLEAFMRNEDIEAHAKKFSKSFSSKYSPWNAANDPEGWMPRKTVLKQAAKLAPKNETIARAIELDNRDSTISDREERRRIDAGQLKEGAPTISSLTKDHAKDKEGEAPQSALDFGVAGSDTGK